MEKEITKMSLSDKRMISEHSPHGAYEHTDVREAIKEDFEDLLKCWNKEKSIEPYMSRRKKRFGEELTK